MNVKGFVNDCLTSLESASPKIKIVVGVVGLIGAGVMACVASTKVKEETKEERKAFKDIHKIRHAQNADKKGEVITDPNEQVSEDVKFIYTDKDFAKDVVRTSLSYGKKILKLYGVPFAIATISTVLVFNGTHVLNKRYLAMAALASSQSKAIDTLMSRIRERYGDEVANDIKYGLKTEKIIETEVDKETGEVKEVEKEVKVPDGSPTAGSTYAFIFDERFGEFTGDLGFDLTCVKGIEAMLNDELICKERRYLTLNNLYDRLGAPEEMYLQDKCKAMICGWINGSKKSGDCYIDLRVQTIYIEKDGKRVPRLLLDPNVVGNIYLKLNEELGYAA